MVAKRALSALSKIGIIIAIAVAFIFGLAGTVYLSLRSPEVKVPDVKGKDRMTAEAALDDLGLHMKVRATRFSPEAKPDTVLDQLPQKDEVIKVGQTVAVVVARGAKEGESASTAAPGGTEEKKPEADKTAENKNAGQTQTAANQNENQNKPKRTKNANNKNANNSNNSNNGNANRNANARNANAGNANNRNANTGTRNANANRSTGNGNTEKRAPIISTPSTPPFVPSGPPRLR
jgi:beta-lactam-binding protein with PASTA domain